MSEKKRVLTANSEFYQAFHECNSDRMNEIWSRREDITVIHPGHPLLQGRDNVLTSWRQILSSIQSFDIHCCNAMAFVNDSVAYVICNETLPEQHVNRDKYIHTGRQFMEADPSPGRPGAGSSR